MNPPFAQGEKHLLKALEMQERGGAIICILNAETIRNPNNLTRVTVNGLLESVWSQHRIPERRVQAGGAKDGC